MALLDAITEAASAEHDDGGILVTEFIVIASFVGNDGERNVYTETVDGQTCHQSLGLLAFGMAQENRRAIEDWQP